MHIAALIEEWPSPARAWAMPTEAPNLPAVPAVPTAARHSGHEDDLRWVAAVRQGDPAPFENLVLKYQARIFATARRYSRREHEVQDIVQEIFLKAFQKIGGFRGDAPFEHWLMRLAVRTCYDSLRVHQRNRELSVTDLASDESEWLERCAAQPDSTSGSCDAARQLVAKVFERLSPAARLVLTLLEIEDRSVKEISALTGWSVPLVKVRAFRARAEMRKCLKRLALDKYL
jgi:RNA polymerase sigma-70 factor, ECF subfamily